jgi:hypothetical protein
MTNNVRDVRDQISDARLLSSGIWHLASALAGGAERDRTVDLLLAKQALSQLSYSPSSEVSNQKTEVRSSFLTSDF